MKLRNPFKSFSKRSKIVATSLVLAAIIGLPIATNAGFFPGRPTFDYNKFDANNLNCNDPANPAAQNGRCGSMTGPVFNSFVNTPSYGDERYFTDGYRTDKGESTTSDTIKDVTDGSKQVVIRVYVHNNANQDTNSTVGMARNTKVGVELPTNSGSALQAVGAISADNATPREVTDTVYMTAGRAFKVKYVPGSAKLIRGANTYAISDSVVSGGAPVGHTQMDGNMPGCFEFAAFVEVKVDILPEASTNLQLLKQVKNVGDTTGWHKEVASKPGQEEQWLLTTKNIALDPLTNVQVRDILPPHLALVPGSVKVVNSDQSSAAHPDAPLFGNGIGLGTYPSGGGRYVMFKTKALDDFAGCSVRVRNVAKAKSTQTPTEIQDSADVVITKENCKPEEPVPAYSCDLLTATKGDNRTVTFTTSATAVGGAKITVYHYNFGDGTPVLVTDKATVTHQYAKDGQFAARVKVQVDVKGTPKFAESDKCAAAVTFTTPTTPGNPVTPVSAAPTTLVSTGPGSIAAIFAAVTALGAIAHRWYIGRRLSA